MYFGTELALCPEVQGTFGLDINVQNVLVFTDRVVPSTVGVSFVLGNMFRSFLLNNRFVITFFFSLSRFSLLLSRSSNPGSHTSRLFSPPLHYVRSVPCIFYREKIFALSFLVDSRRIAPTHSRRSQQLLILFIFLQRNLRDPTTVGLEIPAPTLAALEGNY